MLVVTGHVTTNFVTPTSYLPLFWSNYQFSLLHMSYVRYRLIVIYCRVSCTISLHFLNHYLFTFLLPPHLVLLPPLIYFSNFMVSQIQVSSLNGVVMLFISPYIKWLCTRNFQKWHFRPKGGPTLWPEPYGLRYKFVNFCYCTIWNVKSNRFIMLETGKDIIIEPFEAKSIRWV
jgi:hypothetical protein